MCPKLTDFENAGSAAAPQVAPTTDLAPSIAGEANVRAAVQLAQSEIECMITLANRFPRNEKKSEERLKQICSRPGFAKLAHYKYPRGGKDIEGESIKFAREAGKAWGHIRMGYRVQEDFGHSVLMQGFAWDLQSNTLEIREITINMLQPRKMSDGTTRWVPPVDERDRLQLVHANGAKLERNAILGVIPADIIEECSELAKLTARSGKGEGKTLEQRRNKMIQAFKEYGIEQQQIEEYQGKALNLFTAEDLHDLQMIFNAIQEGTAPEEIFRPPPPAGAKEETPGAADTLPEERTNLTNTQEIEKEIEYVRSLKKDGLVEYVRIKADEIKDFPIPLRKYISEGWFRFYGNILDIQDPLKDPVFRGSSGKGSPRKKK